MIAVLDLHGRHSAAGSARSWPYGMAERLVVPMKPGNPRWWEGASVERKPRKQRRIEGLALSLTTPLGVQKLQSALHDKAKRICHTPEDSFRIARDAGSMHHPAITLRALCDSCVPFENDRFAKRTTARNGKAIHGDGQAGTATGAPAPAGNWIDLRLRRCGVGKND